jgi:plasmid segregation protein ParM
LKHYKNIVIVGIDHGYGNIKTAQTVTPTGIMKLDTEPTFTDNVLFYDGGYYRIGEGHKEFISDKWEDNDFYLFTLMAIAKELKREGIGTADVHLAVGLPLTWVDRQREDFRRYMLQRESVDFKFADKSYAVRIVGCTVYPQGYAAVIDYLHDMTGVNMLADIGNGTVNIMNITNRRPVSAKSHTEKLGVNQCVIAASNAVMDKLGVKIDDAIIQQAIRYGKADIAEEYFAVLKTSITQYAGSIFDMLRRYEYNPKLMRLYITGGGGKLIENFGRYERDRVTIIGDICASAKGYEQFALMTYRKGGKA